MIKQVVAPLCTLTMPPATGATPPREAVSLLPASTCMRGAAGWAPSQFLAHGGARVGWSAFTGAHRLGPFLVGFFHVWQLLTPGLGNRAPIWPPIWRRLFACALVGFLYDAVGRYVGGKDGPDVGPRVCSCGFPLRTNARTSMRAGGIGPILALAYVLADFPCEEVWGRAVGRGG